MLCHSLKCYHCLFLFQRVFNGDDKSILSARAKIRTDFNTNKHVQSATSQTELINLGQECDRVLREQVFQAEVTSKGGDRLHFMVFTRKVPPLI